MPEEEIKNSYVNLAEPTAKFLLELVRAHGGDQPKARQAVIELSSFLERFTPEQWARNNAIRQHAEKVLRLSDGELEMDANAVVSEGDDNGAYVMLWGWVSFADSDLNKDKELE